MSDSLSVHDNCVLSIEIDCTHKRIVFHTIYHGFDDYIEHTDIVFESVLAYHWEGDNMGTILFDAEEISLDNLFPGWADLFENRKNYGWLPFTYHNPDDVKKELTERQVKTFSLTSSCGLDGFVLARSMTIRESEK